MLLAFTGSKSEPIFLQRWKSDFTRDLNRLTGLSSHHIWSQDSQVLDLTRQYLGQLARHLPTYGPVILAVQNVYDEYIQSTQRSLQLTNLILTQRNVVRSCKDAGTQCGLEEIDGHQKEEEQEEEGSNRIRDPNILQRLAEAEATVAKAQIDLSQSENRCRNLEQEVELVTSELDLLKESVRTQEDSQVLRWALDRARKDFSRVVQQLNETKAKHCQELMAAKAEYDQLSHRFDRLNLDWYQQSKKMVTLRQNYQEILQLMPSSISGHTEVILDQ